MRTVCDSFFSLFLCILGYIEPVQDKLQIYGGDDGRKQYELCQAHNTSSQSDQFWKEKALLKLDQKAQEDWYASWVSELIRIAKPGATIIVEQVSLPQCEDLNDWGGVSKSWWKEAVQTYEWDVDPTLIKIQDFNREHGRYHVQMVKNGEKI